MKKEKEELTITDAAAEQQDSIDEGVLAETENPQSGEEGFDAESESKAEKEFDELISGKYKKQFAERVKKIIDRRLKGVKKVKETSEKYDRIMKFLEEKLGSEDEPKTENNTEDGSIIRKLMLENAYLRKMGDARRRQSSINERVEKWKQQAEELKAVYPDFDFAKELKNEEFCRLLKAGVSVKNAYEVTNMDSILDKNTQDAEKKVVNSIRSKGARPVENGLDGASGILLSSNVSNLSKKERAELARRAARGEKISLS